MPKKNKVYRFKAIIERIPGKFGPFFIFFPFDVEKEFGVRGSVRVKGKVNSLVVDRALIPRGDGTHHLLFPKDLQRKARAR